MCNTHCVCMLYIIWSMVMQGMIQFRSQMRVWQESDGRLDQRRSHKAQRTNLHSDHLYRSDWYFTRRAAVFVFDICIYLHFFASLRLNQFEEKSAPRGKDIWVGFTPSRQVGRKNPKQKAVFVFDICIHLYFLLVLHKTSLKKKSAPRGKEIWVGFTPSRQVWGGRIRNKKPRCCPIELKLWGFKESPPLPLLVILLM